MHIQPAKQEYNSLTILSAQWLKRLGTGFAVGNAIALGISLSFPQWYESKMSRPVMGLNAMFAMLGVKEAQGIRRGRLNAGGIQERGKDPVFLDRIIPADRDELHFIKDTVEVTKAIGAKPEQIKQTFEKVGRIEAELSRHVSEKTSAIAELSRTQRELENAKKAIEGLTKGRADQVEIPEVTEGDDPLFAIAEAKGKVI